MRTHTITFGGLDIAFDERLLRPRAWTVAQSTWAAELLVSAPAGPVLELCAGAGHIGLLAVLGTDRPLVCVDVSAAACEYARANARAAGLAEQVEVRCGSVTDAGGDGTRYAMVLADPPWVLRSRTHHFPEDPVLAIDGGEDGLAVARDCVATAARCLLPGGSLLLQLGDAAQVDLLTTALPEYGDLSVQEVRTYDRGVLVRLDRPSGS